MPRRTPTRCAHLTTGDSVEKGKIEMSNLDYSEEINANLLEACRTLLQVHVDLLRCRFPEDIEEFKVLLQQELDAKKVLVKAAKAWDQI